MFCTASAILGRTALNCFAEHGTGRERVVANAISTMYNILIYGHLTIVLSPDDTFINTMLRINMSLTNEMSQVVLTTMEVSSKMNGVKNLATVWKMVIEKNLTTTDQVQQHIELFFPNMNTSRNRQY